MEKVSPFDPATIEYHMNNGRRLRSEAVLAMLGGTRDVLSGRFMSLFRGAGAPRST